MGKQSRRSRIGKKRKGKDKAKNKAMRNLEQSERIVETRIAREEAQEYLEERGFGDRQLRAWGETNAEYRRYH